MRSFVEAALARRALSHVVQRGPLSVRTANHRRRRARHSSTGCTWKLADGLKCPAEIILHQRALVALELLEQRVADRLQHVRPMKSHSRSGPS